MFWWLIYLIDFVNMWFIDFIYHKWDCQYINLLINIDFYCLMFIIYWLYLYFMLNLLIIDNWYNHVIIRIGKFVILIVLYSLIYLDYLIIYYIYFKYI